MAAVTRVYLEVGAKKVFACSLDWPGWCRSAKEEEAALEALAEYASRFKVVADEAGLRFPKAAGEAFDVVERVKGNATTDFGAPGVPPAIDGEAPTAAVAKRDAALVRAAWTVFDRVVAASPAELRKGPRGGGRDRDKMAQHVLGAEVAYARTIGTRHKEPAWGDAAAISAVRDDIVDALLKEREVTGKSWPRRYAARRIAWHVLDHAWEMEDRRQ